MKSTQRKWQSGFRHLVLSGMLLLGGGAYAAQSAPGIIDAAGGENIYLSVHAQQSNGLAIASHHASFREASAPVYVHLPLAQVNTQATGKQIDLSGLVGGQLYVGQGLNESAMTAGAAPSLSYLMLGTLQDASGDDAESEENLAMATSVLLQGTTPALGSLSYANMSVVFLPEDLSPNGSSYTVTITRKSGHDQNLATVITTHDRTWPLAGATACLAPDSGSKLDIPRNRQPGLLKAASPARYAKPMAKTAVLEIRHAAPQARHFSLSRPPLMKIHGAGFRQAKYELTAGGTMRSGFRPLD